MKFFIRYSFIVFVCALLFSSCISNKRVVYFQETNENATYHDTFKYDRNQYKLQVNDVVNLDVKTTNEAFLKLFSAAITGGVQNMGAIGGSTGGDLYYAIGYSINDSGNINFPLLGSVHIAGLTLPEIQTKIENELKVFQQDIQVIARIGGLRISLIGEFIRPGKYVVLQNQLTIFEAIALGGDLKEIAKRDRLVLLRQYPTGAQLHYINVLDKNIINSPYYFLQPNDVLYAEPLKRRAYGVGVNGLQTLSTALSIITTALLLINYFNR